MPTGSPVPTSRTVGRPGPDRRPPFAGPATGDPGTFEAFVHRDGADLVGFARRLTLDHHRAEDLVQDVLARLALSWDKVRLSEDVRAYAYRSVINAHLSWRRRLVSRELPLADPATSGTGSTTPPVDELVVSRNHTAAALAAIRPVQRTVLVLRYHADLPDTEIAALLGCRESTVRSHARRGLAALRRTFSTADEQESGR